MKRILLLAAFFISLSRSLAQIAGYPDFEIVESVPVETNLDNPDVRDAHDVWLEMINGSKSSLDFEEFYVSDQKGEPLEDIIHAIVAAGKRGVQVRLIADSKMYKTYPETVDMLGQKKNIAVRIIDFGRLAGGIQHAKYFTVDSQQVFLGSQNFDWRALKHIHEIGVRIRDSVAVRIYQDVFDTDWQLAEQNNPATIKSILHPKHYPVPIRIVEGPGDTLVFSPSMSPQGLITDSLLWDERKIVELIDGATEKISIQVLTYSPAERGGGAYTVLDDALRRAAARGVKVRLIVSDWSIGNPAVTWLKKLAQVPNIEVKFGSIPQWSGGYVSFARVEHCKYLVVDSSSCWIGTSNWEKSYFYTVRNVGVIVQNNKINDIMERIFLKSWDEPYTTLIKPDGDYQPRKHGEQ